MRCFAAGRRSTPRPAGARTVAARSCAGRGDQRRNAAPIARHRRADRQRDAPAAARRFARRGWCCASRSPRRSVSARPSMPWWRPRLPLVDGGPRRLVHGVLGTLLRRGLPALEAPRLPAAVEDRWRSAWGEDVVLAARRADRQASAARPDLRRRRRGPGLMKAFRSRPRHVRVTERVGRRAAGLRAGALVGPGPRRPRSPRGWFRRTPKMCSTCAPRRAARRCSSPRRVTRSRRVDSSKSRLARLEENLERTHLDGGLRRRRCPDLEPAAPVRRDPARCALLGHRHLPPPSRGPLSRPPADHRGQRRHAGAAARSCRPMAEARRRARLFGLLARAARGRGHRPCVRRPTQFRIVPPEAGELPDFVTASPEGWVRILPGLLEQEGGLDGFFMARLVRARLIPSNRLHGRTAHRSIDPLRRLRQARRGSPRDRRGRRRLDPHRRDGRAFRAQPDDRPGGREGAAPAQRQSRSTSI